MKRSIGYVVACLIVTMMTFIAANTAMAVDELYLCGIVKDVDSRSETVIVDVKSESCQGERRFRVSQAVIKSFIPKSEKCFSIDSDTCVRAKIYDVVSVD